MSEDKNNNQPEMDFGDESSPNQDPLDNNNKWGDNPFEKTNEEVKTEEQPKFEDEVVSQENKEQEADYSFTNDNIEKNRSQNQGLAKVLLVLLLGVGVLIAAVLGLMNNKKDKESTEAVPTNTEAVATSSKDNKQEQVDPENIADPNTYCKLSEAQKYIAKDVDNLDRVLGLLEGEITEINDKGNAPDTRVDFLKTKLEELSRAEADIRAFSKPYIEKDFGISFNDESKVCKVQDGPKYLHAWLDGIKDRIDSLGDELDYVGEDTNESFLAEATDSSKGAGGIASKPVTNSSSQKNKTTVRKPKQIKSSKPKSVAKQKSTVKQQPKVVKRNFKEESLMAANRDATHETLISSETQTSKTPQDLANGPAFKPYNDSNSSLSLRQKPSIHEGVDNSYHNIHRCDSGYDSIEEPVHQEIYEEQYVETEEYCEYEYEEPVYEYCE